MDSTTLFNFFLRERGSISLLLLLNIFACRSGDNSGLVKYYLERSATNTTSNILHFDIQGNFKPKFSISGTKFTASVPLDEIHEMQADTQLLADNFGEVSVGITLYQENNQAYLNDSLDWKSSSEVPPPPIPSFSENASSDSYVYLILPRSRGKNVKEVWVQGDLSAADADGKFYEIPADDQVLLHLSDEEGIKNLKIKYRNIFGTESQEVEGKILKKSLGPINCLITPMANSTSSGIIRTRIQASNVGPLYFKILGDVAAEVDYQVFTESIDTMIGLSAGEGEKYLKFKIKDDANNFCDDITLKIIYDRKYVSGTLKTKNEILWTDTTLLTILPHFDHLPGDNLSMYIRGDIQPANSSFQWIPYNEEVQVSLNPSSGNRHIYVQFSKDNSPMLEVTVPIFLNPYVLISGTGPTYTLTPSEITGLTGMTINGCNESYVNIAFSPSITCTRTQGTNQASIIYFLKDGTSVLRSVPF